MLGQLWDLINFIVKYSLQYKPVVENGEIVVFILNNPRNVLCFNLGADC
jgi:hypothetical protein